MTERPPDEPPRFTQQDVGNIIDAVSNIEDGEKVGPHIATALRDLARRIEVSLMAWQEKASQCTAANGRRGRCPNKATARYQGVQHHATGPVTVWLVRCDKHALPEYDSEPMTGGSVND